MVGPVTHVTRDASRIPPVGQQSSRRRRGSFCRAICLALLAVPLLGVIGCPPTFAPEPDGYLGVVYLNHSKMLAQPILALAYPEQDPVVWMNLVAPGTWDAVLPECGIDYASLPGIIPIDLKTGQPGEQVSYSGPPLLMAQDIDCGSIIVVEIRDNPDAASSNPLVIEVRTIPQVLDPGTQPATTSPIVPGPESGFIVIRPEAVPDTLTTVNASWENDKGRVYSLSWRLIGKGPRSAALVECPVQRLGWGNLVQPDTPGATVGDDEQAISAFEPIWSGSDFACGDAITLTAVANNALAGSVQLVARVNGKGWQVQPGELDLFGNMRRLLDDTGFAGKFSNANALLPPLGVTSSSTP